MIGTPGIRRGSSASPPDVAWAAAQGTTDVLAALGSDIDGLSSSEAARRLATFGPILGRAGPAVAQPRRCCYC